jgi:hypothetical protein
VLTDWLASPLLTQVLWGALFCLPFGFSFQALTLSTLIVGLISIVVTYLLVQKVTNHQEISLFVALLIAFNPLFYSLSATFMMDVHSYALFISSFYLFFLYQTSNKLKFWVWGTIITILGVLLRQVAVVVPLSFLAYSLLQRRGNQRSNNFSYLITSIAVFAIYFGYSKTLDIFELLPSNYRSISEIASVGSTELVWRIFIRAGTIINEAGLWLFPFALIGFIVERRQILKHFKQLALPLALLLIPMIRTIAEMPAGNIFINFGVGPLTTTDIYAYGIKDQPFSSGWIWYVVYPVALAGGIMISTLVILNLIKGYRKMTQGGEPERLISLFIIMLTFGTIIINFTHFDRYLIPLLVPTLLLFSPDLKYSGYSLNYRAILILFITVMAIFSITATKTYLDWNDVRWKAARGLNELDISADVIDGGHEYNGWHGAAIDRYGKWDAKGMEYAITFNVLNGFEVIEEKKGFNWVKMEEYSMYVLKKK